MQKTALITGGNSGIGYATAKLFKEKGYNVTVTGRHQNRVQQAAESLGVEWQVADMQDSSGLMKIAAPFRKTGLDVLVNNAAIAGFTPASELTAALFDIFFHTNVRGPLELIRELLPALEKKQGCIISISSVAATKGLPNASLYAATKGAVEAYTRSLARELAPKKIRVNGVSPGGIDTPIVHKLGLNEQALNILTKRQLNNIPTVRYGTPEEVAQVIASQAEATYVTGAIWAVDGGVGS